MEDDFSKTFLRNNSFGKEHADTYDSVCSNCSHDLTSSKELGMFFCENCGYMFSQSKEKIGRLDYYTEESTRFSDKGQLRCKYYLPFSADEKDVEMEFERWKSDLKMMPSGFKENIKLTNIKKIFVPHAIVSCHGTAVLRGKAISSKPRFWMKSEIETTNYEHVAEMNFAGIPICLNRSIQRELIEAAEPFGFNNICEFSSSAISSDIEVLDINEHIVNADEHISVRILKGMENYSRKIHQKYGDNVSFTENQSKFGDLSFDSCYLPLYLAEYEFNGVKYRVIANGRTGNIACDLPSCVDTERKKQKRREILFKIITNIPYIAVALYTLLTILLFIIVNMTFSLYFIILSLLRGLLFAFIATFFVFILRALFLNLIENVKEGTHYPLPYQTDGYIDRSSVEVIEDKVTDNNTIVSRRDPFLNDIFTAVFDKFFYGSRRP